MVVIPIKCKICDENYKQGIKVGHAKALDDVERVMSKLILPERKLSMNDTTYKYYLNDWLRQKIAKLEKK